MHAIDQTTGRPAFMTALTPAWHGLAAPLGFCPDGETARKECGADWEVALEDLYRLRDGAYVMEKGRKAVVRQDTKATLGHVSSAYEPFQNESLFNLLDSLVGTGEVRYETAGVLKDGRIVWALARLIGAEDEIADGDHVHRYLLGYNSHDGSTAVTIMPTSVRVVCWNTINAADPALTAKGDKDEADASRNAIRIQHSKGMKFKIDDAREVLGLLNGRFVGFSRFARELAATRITDAQFEAMLDRLIPIPDLSKVTRYRTESRATIRRHYEEGPEQEASRGTAWAALNAVTHFVDHDWPGSVRRSLTERQNRENRLYSVMFKGGEAFKRQAARYLGKLAAEVSA